MTWQIDPAHTEIGVRGKHMLISTVKGRFQRYHGDFAIDEADLANSKGVIRIEAASLESGFGQRDDHLRSPDFFNVEQYPEIVFRTNEVRRNGGQDEFEIAGDLTIRDVTRPVVFKAEAGGPLTDPWGGARVALSAEAVVNRKDWGLEGNLPLGTEGLLVGDKITLTIDAELVKAA
jgi:polyisoprenoid-binding protein YceI